MKLTDYISAYYKPPFSVLQQLEQEAAACNFPIIGFQTGQLLQHYASLLQAESVFEMGSGFGYSTLWFAAGMPGNGRIICTDFSEKNLQKATALFIELQLKQQLITRCGDALETIDLYDREFDIIFIDLDKHLYNQAFDAAWPKVKKGGLLLADNIFRQGAVFHPTAGDKSTETIQLFTLRIFNRRDAQTILLPVDDGVLVAMKKQE